MAGRVLEIDVLKIFAFYLLFIFHSSLAQFYEGPMVYVEIYLLTCFFFAAGFLFVRSAERSSAKQFLKSKFFRLYLPFLAALVFFFAFFSSDPMLLVYYATGLSIFNSFWSGSHLWFIPVLLAYFILFLAIHKSNLSERHRLGVCIAMYSFFMLLCISGSPAGLDWRFMVFFWVFFAGTVISEKNRLDWLARKMDNKAVLAASILLFMLSLFDYTPLQEIPSSSAYLVLAEIGYRLCFALSSCFISIWLIRRHSTFFTRFSRFISYTSYASFFGYMLQPVITIVVMDTILLTGASWFLVSSLPVHMGLVIPATFAITVVVSFWLQKSYDGIVDRIRKTDTKTV